MELDELKAVWQQLEKNTQAIAAQIEWQSIKGVERRTSGFVRLCSFEIAFGVATVLVTGACLTNGPRVADFLIPAILLHVAAILTIVSPAWQLATLKATDYSQPIVDIQQRLARIRASRIRFTQAILLGSPLLWAVFPIVVLDGLSGFSVHRSFGAAYVVGNVSFGIVAIPLLYWLGRAIGSRFRGSRAMANLLDGLGGASLSAALRELNEISRFREEP